MKIEIRGKGHNLNFRIPNGLVFSRFSLRIAASAGRKYASDAMSGISPQAMNALAQELKRIQKKHGSWELVEVISADGEIVRVIL